MSDTRVTEEALEQAARLGDTAGYNAATWVFDNTTEHTYAAVLKGIEEGDPLILDSMPEPSLRGGYTERDLFDDLDLDYAASSTGEIDKIADAWLGAARAAFWAEIERTARGMLA